MHSSSMAPCDGSSERTRCLAVQPCPLDDDAPLPYVYAVVWGHGMELVRKISILADAAKYDASCASSGAGGRRSTSDAGIGSTTGMGICHSYAPDGRCISLLKLL